MLMANVSIGAQFPEDLVDLGDPDLLAIAARFRQDQDLFALPPDTLETAAP